MPNPKRILNSKKYKQLLSDYTEVHREIARMVNIGDPYDLTAVIDSYITALAMHLVLPMYADESTPDERADDIRNMANATANALCDECEEMRQKLERRAKENGGIPFGDKPWKKRKRK